MKVTSSETIHFPDFNWGINAGEQRELPLDKKAAAEILKHPSIKEVGTASEAKPKK